MATVYTLEEAMKLISGRMECDKCGAETIDGVSLTADLTLCRECANLGGVVSDLIQDSEL